MDYSILNKYLSGNASEEEVKEILEWIEVSSENRKEFIQYKKAWALTEEVNVDVDSVWTKFFSSKLRMKRKVNLSYKLLYAAGFLLVFSLGMLTSYWFFRHPFPYLVYEDSTSIKVPLGQMSDIVLPDGTTVQLNSGSQLKYTGQFNNGKRTVHLVGEAYFHVAKDHQHPFIVETQLLDFKVYGTSFNVQAYPDDQLINTTLVEGSLGVLGKNGNELALLRPGENIQFSKAANTYSVHKVNIDLYTSWRNGLITFRNESLQGIAKKLERWYNVKIIFKNPNLKNELYYGTIMKNKPIDQILEVFRLTSNIKYKIVTRADKPTLIYWE